MGLPEIICASANYKYFGKRIARQRPRSNHPELDLRNAAMPVESSEDDHPLRSVSPAIEVPSVSEDMGLVETDSDAQLVEVGSDESMETEAFELMEESGETDASVEIAPVKGRRSGRQGQASPSARMRALEISSTARPSCSMPTIFPN